LTVTPVQVGVALLAAVGAHWAHAGAVNDTFAATSAVEASNRPRCRKPKIIIYFSFCPVRPRCRFILIQA